MKKPRIGIIGAGISGLTCAGELAGRGIETVLFDKGFRPGGRLATRRHESLEYDHGAQYFTVRDPRFGEAVDQWRRDGLVDEWKPRIVVFEKSVRRPASPGTRRLVGVPAMNSIAAHLAAPLSVRSGVRIEALWRKRARWIARHASGEEGPFDLVLVSVPAPQAMPLLAESPRLWSAASRVDMSGCWTAMVSFPAALEVDFDAAFVNEGPLSWIARNGSKPGRTGETWILHASPAWTRRHLGTDVEVAAGLLVDHLAALTRVELPVPLHLRGHLWRHALPDNALEDRCLLDGRQALAACGDWCGGPRIEGAWLSGLAAAARIAGWTRER